MEVAYQTISDVNCTCCHTEMEVAYQTNYLRRAQTIAHAATLRWKLPIKLTISPNHVIPTPRKPIPTLTLLHHTPGRVAPRESILSRRYNDLKKSNRYFTTREKKEETAKESLEVRHSGKAEETGNQPD